MSLGKAVPAEQEVPSLIYQLAQASNQKNVEFASITSGGSGGASAGFGERRSASATAGAPPPSAGFTQMPFTFVFNGSFESLYQPLPAARRLHPAHDLRRAAGQRAPAHDPERQAGTWHRCGPASGSGKSLRTARRHDHRDRLRAARRPGPHRRSDARRSRRHGDADRFHRSRRLRQRPGRRAGEPMNDFLNSLKSDLLDRRLLPILALVGVALIAAVAYAVLGGGSSTSSTPTAARGLLQRHRERPRPSRSARRPSTPTRPSPRRPAAPPSSTPADSRNPFTPLPGAKKATSSGIVHRRREELELLRHELLRVETSTSGARGDDARDAAKPTAPAKPRGRHPLPRDRAVRRRAGAGRRVAAAARAAADLHGHGPQRTAPEQGKPAARVPRRGAEHRQGRGLRAHRRGDPARQRNVHAEPDPVSGDRRCRPGRARRSKSSSPPVKRRPTN